MITKELIARINALAHKQREGGLTDAERAEQQHLRATYLADIRAQVKGMLDRVEIVDVVEEERTVRREASSKNKYR